METVNKKQITRNEAKQLLSQLLDWSESEGKTISDIVLMIQEIKKEKK